MIRRQHKYLLQILLTFTVIFSLFQVTPKVFAVQETAVYQDADTSWYDPEKGTEEDPYLIKDAKDLLGLAKLVNEDKNTFDGKYISLVNDIDLAGYHWIPIGHTQDNEDNDYYHNSIFQGTFDGDYHEIFNMNITSAEADAINEVGLFGTVSNAVIKEVGIDGTINITTSSTENKDIGLLVVNMQSSMIFDCYSTGKINVNAKNIYVGGLVGGAFDERSTNIIYGCYSTADIVVSYEGSQESSFVAGLVGMFQLGETSKQEMNQINDAWYDGSIDTSKAENCYTAGLTNFQILDSHTMLPDQDSEINIRNCLVVTNNIRPGNNVASLLFNDYVTGNVVTLLGDENIYWKDKGTLPLVNDSYIEGEIKPQRIVEDATDIFLTRYDNIHDLNSDQLFAKFKADVKTSKEFYWVKGISHLTFVWDKKNIPSQVTTPVNEVTMLRLYNPNSGEHFYTSNVDEKNHLVDLGWHDEGIG